MALITTPNTGRTGRNTKFKPSIKTLLAVLSDASVTKSTDKVCPATEVWRILQHITR